MSRQAMQEEGRCNCLALRQAARYLTASYDQVLGESGLRTMQFSILYKLGARGPQTIGELSAIMAMDRTTLARNLKPLEREDLVRVRSGADRRHRQVELTPSGRKKWESAFPHWQKAQKQFESRFGVARAKQLRGTLRAVLGSGLDPWGHGEKLVVPTVRL